MEAVKIYVDEQDLETLHEFLCAMVQPSVIYNDDQLVMCKQVIKDQKEMADKARLLCLKYLFGGN